MIRTGCSRFQRPFWLASISVKRPVFATVMILTIAVVGFVGYGKLNVDRFPNVDFPIISVITVLPGAAPEEVETELTDKIEEAINTLGGIEELRSVSTEGVSQVYVTFTLDKDVNVAAQEVRDHVGTVLPNLPEGIRDVSDLPNITYELLRRGYSDADVLKILGGNFMRAFAEVERVARVEQRKISGEGSLRRLEPQSK